MSSSYHTPKLLYEGVSIEGLPFKVFESQFTGTTLISFDFESLRKYQEAQIRARLTKYRNPTRIGAYHKVKRIK